MSTNNDSRDGDPIRAGHVTRLPPLPDLSCLYDGSRERSDTSPEDKPCDEAKGTPPADVDDRSPFEAKAESEAIPETSSWNKLPNNEGAPLLKVFDSAKVEATYLKRFSDGGLLERQRVSSFMTSLRKGGEYRKLTTIPSEWRRELRALERRFPNFAAVIDYMKSMLSLAEAGSGAFHLDPMLLVGPPGCGKTYFADTIAKVFGPGYICLRMENAQNNAALAGSSEYWSNTRPGEVLNYFLHRETANPIFLLDEIDKVMCNQYDPVSSLLCLFEPFTAKVYSDLAYPWVEFDASKVTFICTANSSEKLPSPVLDRLTVFEISPPSLEQARRLVRQIHDELKMELPPGAAQVTLSGAAIEVLATQAPRRIRLALRDAIGHALYCRRKRVTEMDLAIGGAYSSSGNRTIGFV